MKVFKRFCALAVTLVMILLLTGMTIDEYLAQKEPSADDVFTEEELLDAMDEAMYFYMDWFYDRSGQIDPAYSDFMQYPPYTKDGTPILYPVSDPDIATYDDLVEATAAHFDMYNTALLLDEIGATDSNGKLYVAKSDGLGGADFTTALEIRMEEQEYGNEYSFELNYALDWDPQEWHSVMVYYMFETDHWVFCGPIEDLHTFFTTLLYAVEMNVVTDF